MTANQAKQNIPKLIDNPHLLVGKTIQHHLADDGVQYWTTGKVTGIAKMSKVFTRIQFSVIYEDEPDTSFDYPLIMDLKNGNVIVNEDLD